MEPDSSGNIPTRDAVEEELAHILSSDHFRTSLNQSKMLRAMVMRKLAGEELTEEVIRRDVYGNSLVSENIIRSTVHILRTKLRDYYLAEGKPRMIKITLPPKTRNDVCFAFNGNLLAARYYDFAIANLDRGELVSLLEADALFDRSFQFHRRHSLALKGKCDVNILLSIFFSALGVCTFDMSTTFRSVALAKAETLAHVNPAASCDSKLIAGAIELLNCNWIDAHNNNFREARDIDSIKCSKSYYYTLYLLTFGYLNEARRAIEALFPVGPPGDAMQELAGCFFFYALRDYERAELCGRRALVKSRRYGSSESTDAARFMYSLVLIQLGRHLAALDELGSISLEVWMERTFIGRKAALSLNRVPGFVVLCTTATHGAERAMAVFRELAYPAKIIVGVANLTPLRDMDIPPTRWDPFQRAVAWIGLGRYDRAVVCLRLAKRNSSPWVATLHYLPLFDPLRYYRPFQKLIEDSPICHFPGYQPSQRQVYIRIF